MLLDDRQRLAQIDKLRELGLDRYVSLPMLVVGGDQSSGKSSVLEALTGLPFPRDSSLCTRFPTNIVFQRTEEASVKASVIPVSEASDDKIIPISTLQGCEVSDADLLEIFAKASSAMNLQAFSQDISTQNRAFSKDMLKIEISSPNHEHFSVVDLPGLFRNVTLGQTTEDDMRFVKEIMIKFIRNPRSIILAVVPANVDITTQEIVQMASSADPATIRTLGVFTKPDLVDRGAEEAILKLLRGESSSSLGYHIVCNRSQEKQKVSLDQRNASEVSFFESCSPWNQIALERVGIESLKRRLNDLSVDATRRSYIDLQREMAQELAICDAELIQLGPEMSTDFDRRQHILRIITEFHSKTRDACDAIYERDACFDNSNLRLASNVAARLDQFDRAVARRGLSYRFGEQPEDASYPLAGVESDTDEMGEGKSENVETEDERNTGDDIYSWIRHEYKATRGFEIGTVNPSVLPRLFQKQVKKWPVLARDLAEDLVKIVKNFMTDLMLVICPEEAIRERLQRSLQRVTDVAFQSFDDQIDKIMEVEFKGRPYTLNHYLSTEINRVRSARYKQRLSKQNSWAAPNKDKDPLVRLADVVDLQKSNEDQIVDDLHDSLKAYCKVARKRFVDNIGRTAKYVLLESPDGPLQSCRPEYVGTLTAEELEDIVKDDPNRETKRDRLKQKHAALKEGLKILR